MNTQLHKILKNIENEYRDLISTGGRHYMEVDLGKRAERLGFSDICKKYRGTQAIIPLGKPGRGMKVRIDGRSFVNYGQFDSGVAVPDHVAKVSGIKYQSFHPEESMILNFE